MQPKSFPIHWKCHKPVLVGSISRGQAELPPFVPQSAVNLVCQDHLIFRPATSATDQNIYCDFFSWPDSLQEVVVCVSDWLLGLVCAVMKRPFTTGACWSLSWYVLPALLYPCNSEISQRPSYHGAHYLCNYLLLWACFISGPGWASALPLLSQTPNSLLHLSNVLDFYPAGCCGLESWLCSFACTESFEFFTFLKKKWERLKDVPKFQSAYTTEPTHDHRCQQVL